MFLLLMRKPRTLYIEQLCNKNHFSKSHVILNFPGQRRVPQLVYNICQSLINLYIQILIVVPLLIPLRKMMSNIEWAVH